MTQFGITPICPSDRSSKPILVVVLEDPKDCSEVMVELPWTERGEPAHLFRRGQRVTIPVSELDLDPDAVARWTVNNPPAVA